MGTDAPDGSAFGVEPQQQEGFAAPTRRCNQRGLCLGEHTFDQPAALLGLPGKTICRAPAGDVQRWGGCRNGAGDRLRSAQQRLNIKALGHRIGGIPFGWLVLWQVDAAHSGPGAYQFLDDGIGIARASCIVIRPDGDCLARQRRPVGFVERRGRAAHGGGGDDATLHQGIGTFFTFDQHHSVGGSDGRQVVERTGFWHSHRPRPHIPRTVLLSGGRVVAIHAGQQAAVGSKVIPLAGVRAEIVIGTVAVQHRRGGHARHHQPITCVFQQVAEVGR